MKLTRRINRKELNELVSKGYVFPKSYRQITFCNEGDIELTLNILRSKLDFDDYIFAPHGYSLSDVKSCYFHGFKGTPKEVKQFIDKYTQ